MYTCIRRIPRPCSESPSAAGLFSHSLASNPFPSSFYGEEQPTALSRTAMDVHFLLRILQVAVNHRVPYGFKERKLHVLFFASDTLGLRDFSHQTINPRRNRFDFARYALADV